MDLPIIRSNADPAPAHRACMPLFENFKGVLLKMFENSITRINFIVINMQCLQYVFYSLLSLQKHGYG